MIIVFAVTGWREHTDGAFIRMRMVEKMVLCRDIWGANMHVRVGDASGADAIVAKWCRDNLVSHHVFHAQRYPSGALMPGAGPRRNADMLNGLGDGVKARTDLLLVFPRTDGKVDTVPGSGTWGCTIMAARMGIAFEGPAYRRSGD